MLILSQDGASGHVLLPSIASTLCEAFPRHPLHSIFHPQRFILACWQGAELRYQHQQVASNCQLTQPWKATATYWCICALLWMWYHVVFSCVSDNFLDFTCAQHLPLRCFGHQAVEFGRAVYSPLLVFSAFCRTHSSRLATLSKARESWRTW